MEFLLVRHGRFPSEYLRLPAGERVAVKALFIDWINQQREV